MLDSGGSSSWVSNLLQLSLCIMLYGVSLLLYVDSGSNHMN